MRVPRPFTAAQSCPSLLVALGQMSGWANVPFRGLHTLAVAILPAMFLLRTTREEIYNILWALVFGFATLNILGLGARRFEQDDKGRLNFGEILAILVVIVSIILLGWEMLYLFHILPIRLSAS